MKENPPEHGAGRGFKDLKVWQRACDLVAEVYRLTTSFPDREVYGLTSQMRRAAVSVPANIAEGAGRGGRKEFLHFLHIARGSLAELETLLELARRLDFINEEESRATTHLIAEVGRMLHGLKRSLRTRDVS